MNKSSVFCKECGRSVRLYKKNVIHRLNDRINLLSILIGFLVVGIFLILSSFFYSLLLSNGIIDFIIYIGLIVITGMFAGGIAIGLIGCSDYHDAKSNGIAFTFIIIDTVAIIFGLGFSTTLGVSSAISSAFGGSSSEFASPSSGFDSNTSSATSNSSPILIFEILIMGILAIVAGIGGCYLGVFLKKFVAD
jgi:hypothetical protein